ncbi:MMPL family transporter [Lentzea roselyniae]|uniref:MMPL family transporter n=1 Tax=Lentzea roselyniae TaxID=531940 RepID=A0ABP7CBP1_9PSEU
MFGRLGLAITRLRHAVLAVALGLAVLGAPGALSLPERLAHGGYLAADSESAQAIQAIRDRVGTGAVDVVVIYRHSRLHTIDDPAFRAGVERSLATAPAGVITSAMSYWTTQNPGLISEDFHAAAVVVMLAGADEDARAASYQQLRDGLVADGFELSYTGPVAVLEEVAERTTADVHRAGLITLPLIMLVLVVVFRGVVAALLPVLLGGLTTVVTLAVLRLVTEVTAINFAVLNAIVAIALAVGTDAALFVVSRFREELLRRPSPAAAIMPTMTTAGRTVFCSGIAISAIVSANLFFPLGFVRSLGIGAAIAAAVGAVLAVTVLPAMLVVLGPRVNALAFGRKRDALSLAEGGPRWARLARAVMRDPLPCAAVAIAVLLLLAVPFFHTRFATADETVLPEKASARIAATQLRSEFGVASMSAIQLTTTFANPLDGPAGERDLDQWRGRLLTVPGVETGMVVATRDRTAVIYLAAPAGGDTREVIRRLRALPAPPGGENLVGGEAAMSVDTIDRAFQRLGWALLYIAVMSFLLLAVALRSIVLPVKALVVNALSLGAAFGAVTWVFQDGHLAWLVGATPVPHIDLFLPVVLLTIVIALATDYELFLLCRVREEYDESGDNETAVAEGVRRSGPIITAAALVVCTVGVGFLSSDVLLLKELCVGMIVAIVLDATVVRLILVPAVMRLLGRANWWLPSFAGRGVPRRTHREPGRTSDGREQCDRQRRETVVPTGQRRR